MKKPKVATIKLIPSDWKQSHYIAELRVEGRKTPAFTTHTLRMKAAITACCKVAKDNGYVVTPPPSRFPSGLTQEDRDTIARLQNRRYQVGLYGDDSSVQAEKRSLSREITRIKDAAKARAAQGLMGSNVKPFVEYNVHIDS